MNTKRLRSMLYSLVLTSFFIVLTVPSVQANIVVDDLNRVWRAESVIYQGLYQIYITIEDENGTTTGFYATGAPDLNNTSPHIYRAHGTDEIWMVWCEERSADSDLFDLWSMQLGLDGPVGDPARITENNGPHKTDVEPCAVAAGTTHHLVFADIRTNANENSNQLCYVSRSEGEWVDSEIEIVTDGLNLSFGGPTILLGNQPEGYPLVVVYNVIVNGGEGEQSQEGSTRIICRMGGSGDPDPWWNVIHQLPDNPVLE